MRIPPRERIQSILLLLLLMIMTLACGSHAWQWSDFVSTQRTNTLTLQEVSEMRVRDIKRRLARQHGYGAEELNKMLDKKELINALAYEEYKILQTEQAEAERLLLTRGIIVAVVAVLLVLCWPLLQHVYEVGHVNFVVYTDRKLHEAKKCWEFKSIPGILGVVIMAVLDVLNLWLTVTVLASWVLEKRWYFFPIPSLPIRPAQFMGGEVASGPLSRYGINTGPMLVTWLLRFLHGRVEAFVGRALLQAQKASRKTKKKKRKTPAEREAKKLQKEAKRKAQEKAKQQAAQQEKEETIKQQEQPGQEQQANVQPEQQQKEPETKNEPIQPPSREEARDAAAAAAESRWNGSFEPEMESAFDDLD